MAQQAATQQRYQVEQTPDGKSVVRDTQTGELLNPEEYRETSPEEQARGIAPIVYLSPGARASEEQFGQAEIVSDTDDDLIFRYGSGSVWRLDKKTQTVREHTLQSGIPEGVKRVVAGPASYFSDITGNNPGYFPAAPEQLAAFGYMLADLIPGTDFGDDNYFTRATERVIAADDSMRHFLDITPPENVGDLALEIGGSLLLPGPKITGAVRGAPNLLGKTSIPFLSGRSGGLIQDAADVAVETLLPLRQGNLVPALATQVPLGIGITETIDAAGNLDDPGYKGFVDWIDSSTREEGHIKDGIPDEIKQGFLALDENDPKREQVAELILEAIETGEYVAPQGPEPAWRNSLGVGSAFTALGLGTLGVRQYARQNASQRLRGTTSLTGVEYNPITTSVGTQAIGSVVQADQPIREAVRSSIDQSDPVIRRLDRVTAPSLNTITSHGIATGEFPNSAIKATPVAATLNAVAKDLSAEEWTVLSDGLLARNALDDLNNTGNQAAFNDLTPDELQIRAERLENDPKLARYGEAVKRHYRDNIDFMLEQGLITAEMHTALTTARPNYVHMSRNLITEDAPGTLFGGTRFSQSAREHLNDLLGRNTEEGSGVQTGRAADPVRELAGQSVNVMRRAEINNIKKELFDIFENNTALADVVKRIPDGEQPKNLEGIHDVIVDGTRRYYKITDPALDAAMRFNPYLGHSVTRMALGFPKRMQEFWLTGPGNPFFAPTAAAYDTFTGMALRPRGYDLGLGSELLNRVFPRSGGLLDQVKAADPTTLVSAPVGAVRLLYDEFIGGAARSLTDQLMRQDGPMYNILGPQNATLLRDRLAAAYDGSVRSLMDQYGASTAGIIHTTDANLQARALADLAPNFFSRASRRAMEEALNGDPSFFNGIVQGSRAAGNNARANAITRLYMNVVRSMHEGFRYQAFATNLPKVRNDPEGLQRIASQTRRISGDVMQRGSGEAAGFVTSTAMYANPAIQGLSQVARQLKDQPVTTATNTLTMLTMLTALTYGAAASDPRVAAQMQAMTDDEVSRKAITYGGIEIPISPELRMLWGPYAALMNEISGINSGQFNPDIGQVLDRWLDGEIDVSEEGEFSIAESLKAGVESTMPLQFGSFPVVNAMLSTQGIDAGMTRYTGSPQEIATQNRSGLGGEGALTGDAVSAQTMSMIEDIMGATVANWFRMGMDIDRALDADAETDEAIQVGISRLEDNTVRSSGITRGMLFGNYEKVQSANDTETRLWYAKDEGIERARSILRQDVVQAYVTGADPRSALLRNTDTIPPDLSGTALVPIGLVSADLMKAVRPLQTRLNELRDQVAETQNQRLSTIEERNAQINEFNEERRELTAQMLLIAKQAEEAIRQTIGDPSFSYQNFDPEVYRNMAFPPVASPTMEQR